MKILPGDQLSAEWFQAHCGVVSGSYMSHVLAFNLNGPMAKRLSYQRMKLAELVSGEVDSDNYCSKDMLAGIEREPRARALYELEESEAAGQPVMVEEVGFALHDTVPRFGGSVDGLVGEDGMIEIKCPRLGTHLAWLIAGCVPPAHVPQINSYLAITGRAWCDFVTFHPAAPIGRKIMTIRWQRDDRAIARMLDQVIRFNHEIDDMVERLQALGEPFELPAAQAAKVAGEQFTEQEDASLGISDEDIAWAAGGFRNGDEDGADDDH